MFYFLHSGCLGWARIQAAVKSKVGRRVQGCGMKILDIDEAWDEIPVQGGHWAPVINWGLEIPLKKWPEINGLFFLLSVYYRSTLSNSMQPSCF